MFLHNAIYLVADVLLPPPPEAVELCRGQDVRDGSEAMEDHGNELDDDDKREEEHEDDSDGLKVEVLLRHQDLEQR